MYLYLAIAVWLGGVWFSYANGNVKLPLTVFVLGVADLIALYKYGFGGGLAVLCVLGVVMLISLKIDSAMG
ncbi:MAG: hypothetical protein OEY19_03070 [Gammaproteobacteria bacterium]|nr:hypothetical protein [Gammaproteobacteria bacterium]